MLIFVCRIIFGELSRLESLKWPVVAAEEDLKITNSLVISASTQLASVSLISGMLYRIGSRINPAQFGHITGFHQASENEILVVDYKNNCIQMIIRQKGEFKTPVIAGKCEEQGGYIDGKALDSRFERPHRIIASPTVGSFYITEERRIRILNTLQKTVSTLLKHEFVIQDAKLSPSKEHLFFINVCQLYRHTIATNTTVLFTGNKAYCGRGDSYILHEATFLGLNSLLFLNEYTIMMSDYRQGHLRIINLCSNTVSTFCLPSHLDEAKSVFISGPKSVCSLSKPGTLMYSMYLKAVLIMSGEHQPLMLPLQIGWYFEEFDPQALIKNISKYPGGGKYWLNFQGFENGGNFNICTPLKIKVVKLNV